MEKPDVPAGVATHRLGAGGAGLWSLDHVVGAALQSWTTLNRAWPNGALQFPAGWVQVSLGCPLSVLSPKRLALAVAAAPRCRGP